MKIVVELDDELYNDIFADREKFIVISGMRSGKTLFATLMRAIGNGKVLPKGHGALKDENEIIAEMRSTFDTQDLYLPIHFKSLLGGVPTIVEADEEGVEE